MNPKLIKNYEKKSETSSFRLWKEKSSTRQVIKHKEKI